MVTTLSLVTLLSAAGPSVAAQSAPTLCQTFTREAAAAPPLVRAWLAESGDQRVRICPQPGATGGEARYYFGEGAVGRRGAVCSYLSHGLTTIGDGAARRLRRIERSEAVAMALADHDCPQPHPAAAPDLYVMTYDVSPTGFAAIMELWLELIAAGPPINPNLICCALGSASRGASAGSPAAVANLKRLQAAVEDGRLQKTGITRIVRLPGSALRHRYALFVKDPDQERPVGQPGMYVIYVQKRLRGPYQVSDLGESN
jgi:hypothetical protein